MTIRRGWAGAAVVLAVLAGSPAFAQDQQPRKPAAAKARAKAGTVKPKAPPPEAAKAPPPVESEAEAEVEVGTETEAAPPETEAAPSETKAAPAEAEEPAADPAEDAVDPEPEAEPARKHRPTHKHRPRYRPYAPSPDGAPPPLPYEMEYIDGAEVPDGYTKVERVRKGLVIAGAVTFGVGWLSAAAAAAMMTGGENECVVYEDGEGGSYSDWCDEGPDEEEIAPLFVPIVGPFIAMGTIEHQDGATRAALLVNGVVQVGGAAMLIAGIAATRTVLVRTKYAKVSVSPGPGTLHLNGSF